MNKSFYNFLLLLADSFNRSIYCLKIPYNSNIKKFCNLLHSEGFLYYFKHNNNNLILFFKTNKISYNYLNSHKFFPFKKTPFNLTLSRNHFFSKFKINSIISKKVYLSYTTLVKTYSFTTIRILSTDKGFQTCYNCIKKKIGGILLCTFWL